MVAGLAQHAADSRAPRSWRGLGHHSGICARLARFELIWFSRFSKTNAYWFAKLGSSPAELSILPDFKTSWDFLFSFSLVWPSQHTSNHLIEPDANSTVLPSSSRTSWRGFVRDLASMTGWFGSIHAHLHLTYVPWTDFYLHCFWPWFCHLLESLLLALNVQDLPGIVHRKLKNSKWLQRWEYFRKYLYCRQYMSWNRGYWCYLSCCGHHQAFELSYSH